MELALMLFALMWGGIGFILGREYEKRNNEDQKPISSRRRKSGLAIPLGRGPLGDTEQKPRYKFHS